jgi:lysozyme
MREDESVPVQQPTSFADGDVVKGVDVSHRQDDIDWARVAGTGVQFCYIKATEGEGLKDVRFRANFDGAKAAGLFRGAYHFFRPDKDAEAQAQSFLHVVPSLSAGDLPPALDVEVGTAKDSTAILDGIQTWVEAVENVLGRQPILYTYPSFRTQTLSGSARFASYLLWAAHYTFKPAPTLPRGFEDYVFWQFSEQGQVDGISGNVDLDRFHGSLEDLRALAWL